MSQPGPADDPSPPSTVAYIESMLIELAVIAGRAGETDLCAYIEASAHLARSIEARRARYEQATG